MKQRSRKCRCHGVSGTCSAQTCYEAVMDVETAGEIIVERYNEAVQVNETVTIPQNETEITDMVYKNPSPDFCNSSEAIGVLGVKGRVCDPNHPTRNCTYLCCGEGNFNTESVRKPIEICKFKFCCEIKCEIIRYEYVSISTCK